LPLGLSFVQFSLRKNALDKLLILCCELLLKSSLLVQLLLLNTGLKLVFVLEGLAFEIFLLHDTLFVFFPALSAHSLLSADHFLVALQLKLYLVLRLPLPHFGFELHCLAFLLLHDLGPLDLQLAAR
jgi:hypothetical protein